VKLSGMSWTASSDSEDGAPRWGRISDQRARTLALMAGFAAFLVGSAIAAMAPHLGLVYPARIVAGAGAGAIMPADTAILRTMAPPWIVAVALCCSVAHRSSDLLRDLRSKPGWTVPSWGQVSGRCRTCSTGHHSWLPLSGNPASSYSRGVWACKRAISLAPTAAPTTSVQRQRFIFASMLLAPTRSRRARRSLYSGTRYFATDRPRP